MNIQFSKIEAGHSERKKHVQTCQLMRQRNPFCFAYQIHSPVANRPHGTRLRTLKILMSFLGSFWQNTP